MVNTLKSKKERGHNSASRAVVAELFRMQNGDPNFYNIVSLGPSNLLKSSGSIASIPAMGDYHQNIKKLSKYQKHSPASYHLPSLFDNYNENNDLNQHTQHSHHKLSANH
jgi:hypothetical protein